MSNLSGLSQGDVIDFTTPSPKTPPPVTEKPADEVNEQQLHGEEMNRSTEVVNSPEPTFQSPTVAFLRKGVTNSVSSPAAGVGKPNSQSIYLRVMGRKPGTNSNETPSSKPFKATPINYSIMGLFSKESNEVRIAQFPFQQTSAHKFKPPTFHRSDRSDTC